MNQNIERDSTHGPQLFGQPRGLATLFMTEMWERFTYYGMRAILILFMAGAIAEGGLGLDDKTASAVYGLYIAATYLLAPMGGWIADRLIGQQRSVFWGGVLIMLGNGLLAAGDPQLFFIGLVVIVLGVGLLKPNISAIVAQLYPEGGSRRDAGFSIFYMGINLGAVLGSLLRPDHRGGVRLERRLRVAGARHAVRPGAVPGHEKSSRHFRPRAARQAGDVVADRRLHGRAW